MTVPGNVPNWAINPDSKVEAPSTTFANQGYEVGNKPTVEHFNYMFKFLTQLVNSAADGELASLVYFSSVANLKAVNTNNLANHATAYLEGIGAYILDKSLTTNPSDDFFCIKPTTGAGRWILFLLDPLFTFTVHQPTLDNQEARLQKIEKKAKTDLKRDIAQIFSISSTYSNASIAAASESTFFFPIDGLTTNDTFIVNGNLSTTLTLVIVSQYVQLDGFAAVKIRNNNTSVNTGNFNLTLTFTVFKK